MARDILIGNTVRELLYDGVAKLAEVVGSTLGPHGQNVIIARPYTTPLLTKDGVTVAKEVFLSDRYQSMGCEIAKEAAARLANSAGDGTTTTIILTAAIMKQAKLLLDSGYSPITLQNEMNMQVKACGAFIERISRKVESAEDVFRIASISANNDSFIGDLIKDAYEKTGHATIVITESKGTETTLKVTTGLEINRGWLAPHFVTDPKTMTWRAEDVRILLYDDEIKSVEPLMRLLEHCSTNSIPLVIIANDIAGETLSTLAVNAVKGTLKVCAIRAPLFGDRRDTIMEDLAIVTGGQVISERSGNTLESLSESGKRENLLGTATGARITKDTASFSGGQCNTEFLDLRIQQVKDTLSNCSRADEDFHRIRLAKLKGGISELEIGGATDTEMIQRKARADDAVCATRAALEEGIVPGGGALYAYMSMHPTLQIPGDGASAVRGALTAPISKLFELSGSALPTLEKFFEHSSDTCIFGRDFVKEKVGDMFEMGIIDPAKVTRIALESAVSVACLLLTSSALIVPMELKDPIDDHQHNVRG